MTDQVTASNNHHATRKALDVTNIALIVLALIVAIMLVVNLMLLKPVTGVTAPTPMPMPTSDY
jgi:hypothetical protein